MDKFKNLEKPIWIQASIAFVYAKTIRAYLRVKVLGLPPCCICPVAWSKVLSKVFLSRRWVGGGGGGWVSLLKVYGRWSFRGCNRLTASSDPAPVNGERQLWGYLLNFCILIERLTKAKKKSLSYVNSQSEKKKILETADQKAGKAVLMTEGTAVLEVDCDLGWWITIPNSLPGFNCERIFHFINFGS